MQCGATAGPESCLNQLLESLCLSSQACQCLEKVNSAAVRIPKLAKGAGREGLQEPEALGHRVSKGEVLGRCLAHPAGCLDHFV